MLVWMRSSRKNKTVRHAFNNLLIKRFKNDVLINCMSLKEIIKHTLFLRLGKEIIVDNPVSAILFSLLSFKVTLWLQGTGAHESYQRRGSVFRFSILQLIDIVGLRLSDNVIFVSDYMEEIYVKNYPWLKGKTEVIYCSSDLKYNAREKIKNSFCYVGGVSTWQMIDDVLLFFNNIKKSNNDYKIYIVTRNVDEVLAKISKGKYEFLNDIVITSIEDRHEMENFLSSMEFGVLLREDNMINNVASPIKLAEYLSCDVNVITTTALTSFYRKIEKYDCGYLMGHTHSINSNDFSYMIYKKGNSLKMYNEVYSEL
ncbi:hypothetical protein [Vibrio campbellii]|uniref:Uncharacterized protein n=2 Tax=Vibrio campbellii TaxID=680 RepID=A7MSL3_VIBC1|nr:hypothetical protein [Vibrio campbellii]ABU69696.1 hypothetical protein VIBHAR_00694 [Vibrio campbellii ATCC BAA-1116]AGU96585.1 hypothetical protein M892_09375 [Vibrio campbellii ATCC BAA-1116]MBT0120109.1 glycosyltransferase family 4 protein [Vibrio campbellii]MBT0135020.1 glycosyltransferase family 4 protein [Vibrio campbellii]MBT0139700.1 glycosyltransferase family 4 protein [Vibrio campbellii]